MNVKRKNRKYTIMLAGEPNTGKSSSLYSLRHNKRVVFINADAGKDMPFEHDWHQIDLLDPLELPQILMACNEQEDVDTIIIDTLSNVLNNFVSLYVAKANGFEGWNAYGEYIKEIFLQQVPRSKKNLIFLTHTETKVNKVNGHIKVQAFVQGKLGDIGIENYFTIVLNTKKIEVDILKLPKYANPHLTFNEAEIALGFKFVFQVQTTGATIHENVRTLRDLWNINEIYIDNDISIVLNRLEEYRANFGKTEQPIPL